MSTDQDNQQQAKATTANPNKRLSLQEQKDALRLKQKADMDKLNSRIRAQESRDKEKQRKLDNHYKIIEGALSRNHRLKNPNSEQAKVMNRIFNEYLVKDDERLFFGLETLSEAEKVQRTAELKASRKKRDDLESID